MTVEKEKESESGRRCPKCLSKRVHRSRSRGPEVVVRLVGLGFYRCHHCQYRFIRFRGWTTRQKRLMLLVGGSALLLLLVWYGVRFFNRETLP